MLHNFKEFIVEKFIRLHLEEERNPAFKGNTEIQKLDRDIKSGKHSEEELSNRTSQVYEKISPLVDKAHKSLVSTIKGAAGKKSGNKILHGTKPIKSVIDKAVKRKKGLGNLGDLARAAVITKTPKETERFVNALKRKHGDKIVDHEVKEKGSDSVYGYYGSHHIQMIHHGVETELQVMHKGLWNKKKMAHKIYTASRSRPSGATKQEKTTSKQIFIRANAPREVIPDKRAGKRDFSKLNLQQSYVADDDKNMYVEMIVSASEFYGDLREQEDQRTLVVQFSKEMIESWDLEDFDSFEETEV